MKWKDKNGNSFEGTVGEYLSWKDIQDVVRWKDGNNTLETTEAEREVIQKSNNGMILEPKKIIFYHKKKRTHTMWSSREIRLLKEVFSTSTDNKLKKLFPDRSLIAIHTRASILGISSINSKRKLRRTTRYKAGRVTGTTIRLRFMNERANKYMREYNWSRERALTVASSDWNYHKKSTLGTVEGKKNIFESCRKDLKTGKEYVINTFTSKKECEEEVTENNLKAQQMNIKDTMYFMREL